MATTEVVVRRVPPKDEHDGQKWYVIEGSVEGYPMVTKRESIAVAALASGSIVLADRVAKMRADVAEYLANYKAIEGLETL
jgi:hypothetical protein